MIHTLCWARFCFPCFVPNTYVEVEYEERVQNLINHCRYQEALDVVDEALDHTSCGWFNTNTMINYAQNLRIQGCYIAYLLGRYHKALEYDSDDIHVRILCYMKLGRTAPKFELKQTCSYVQCLYSVSLGVRNITTFDCTYTFCPFYKIKYLYAIKKLSEAKQ